jgi:hypothetical protein
VQIHQIAFKKFGVLWLISVSPLVLAALLSPIGSSTGFTGYCSEFFKQLVTEFNGTHQYIYTVSFIAPILYLVIERYSDFVAFWKSNRRKAQGAVKVPPEGFGVTLFWSFLVFLFTIAGYVAAATIDMRAQKTILDSLSQSTVFIVYLFALFCWYFSILDSTPPPISNFSSTKKKNEEDFTNAFNSKVGEI